MFATGGGDSVSKFGHPADRRSFPATVANECPIVIEEQVKSPPIGLRTARSFNQQREHVRKDEPTNLHQDAEPLTEHCIALDQGLSPLRLRRRYADHFSVMSPPGSIPGELSHRATCEQALR